MCRAFQPFTMQGIYFSLCASTQIKTYPFHLCLLQSHHIPREKNPASQKNRSFCSTSIIDKPKKLRLSLRLSLSLKNCFSAKGGVFP